MLINGEGGGGQKMRSPTGGQGPQNLAPTGGHSPQAHDGAGGWDRLHGSGG